MNALAVTATPVDSAAVARRSRSNLAFALACLPAERRRDMISFYAFCRIVDDIADEGTFSIKDRRIQLAAWRRIVRGEQLPPDAVAREVVVLPEKYAFDRSLLEEIIEGVSMDLENRTWTTWEDLRSYCYKVASVVGLVSLPIFGAKSPAAADYAVNLGYALQLTNILRDIRADSENEGRLYLPLEDLDRFGYHPEDVTARVYNDAFFRLMNFEHDRCDAYYRAAVCAFPRHDTRCLQAAEAMRRIYSGILSRMKADGFRVYDTRYRLGKPRKLAILATAWVRGWIG